MRFVLLFIFTPIFLLWVDANILPLFIHNSFGRTLICGILWPMLLSVGAVFCVDLKSFDDSIGGGSSSSNDSYDFFNNNSANF